VSFENPSRSPTSSSTENLENQATQNQQLPGDGTEDEIREEHKREHSHTVKILEETDAVLQNVTKEVEEARKKIAEHRRVYEERLRGTNPA
jgi:3-oxoacyl-[acyl-carrier-protein] synthase III